ncbi:MAG TPA: N-methyl-D-aspartate receptor NMDAR2C subunit [Planctomycetota bacterium]|jgi:predicted metal-dependent HD superfamily phosphohydrolase
MDDRERWLKLWGRIGARGDGGAVFDDLRQRYSEAQRAYHNLQHIEFCLEEFDLVRSLCAEPEQVEAAIWFHDAIYDPKEKDNEERSAQLAAEVLRAAGAGDELINQVQRLILATKHTAAAQDEQTAILLDIDLAILGRSAAEFDAYEKAIRMEYDWVPAEKYREGRGAVLRGFLARQQIYATSYFREKYEETARENITQALERL